MGEEVLGLATCCGKREERVAIYSLSPIFAYMVTCCHYLIIRVMDNLVSVDFVCYLLIHGIDNFLLLFTVKSINYVRKRKYM